MSPLIAQLLADSEVTAAEIERQKVALREAQRTQKLRKMDIAKLRREEAGIPEPSHHATHKPDAPSGGGDFIYGARTIAKETNQKVSAVYYWHQQGRYETSDGPAVWLAGPRTLMASKSRLKLLGPR
jgi:hypothetical protein